MVIQLHIPDDAQEQIVNIWGANYSREMLEAATVRAYQERKIGTGLVCKLLGFESRWQTIQFLSEKGVYPNYDAQDLEIDRANLTSGLGEPPK